jgi:hypothetical protein
MVAPSGPVEKSFHTENLYYSFIMKKYLIFYIIVWTSTLGCAGKCLYGIAGGMIENPAYLQSTVLQYKIHT